MSKKKKTKPFTLQDHSQYLVMLRKQLAIAKPNAILSPEQQEMQAQDICQKVITQAAAYKIPPDTMLTILRRVLGMWIEVMPDKYREDKDETEST